MTTSRNKRAWSIDGILHRYFQIKDVGPPSCTMSLNDIHVENPERPPRWLVRLCDVGIAIEKLAPVQKETVIARWEAVIGQEDAERDMVVLEARQARLRREGGDWRGVEADKRHVRERYDEHRRIRHNAQRREAYIGGMNKLDEVFLAIVHGV